jgi:predicted transcriptional regulator
MKEKLLLEPQRITAGLIAETKNSGAPAELIFVTPDETVHEAIAKMNDAGVTQLPVIEDNRSVGSLRESRILARLLGDRDLLNAKVSEIMEPSFPVMDVDISLAQIKTELQRAPAVLIEDFKRITGIITRSDVLELDH